MKKIYSYIAIFDYAEDGISIEFPDLPGCLSCADTDEEALYMAKDVLGLHMYGLEEDGEEIPTPSKISDIKLEKNQIPVLVEVFMPTFREKVKSKFIKKTLSIPYWLNAEAEKAGVNFSQELQNALKEKLNL